MKDTRLGMFASILGNKNIFCWTGNWYWLV